jgi:hypothetical protein
MARQHGVQCKACGQSISTGIAGLGLPIPLGPVHCPYCRQEDLYLEQVQQVTQSFDRTVQIRRHTGLEGVPAKEVAKGSRIIKREYEGDRKRV